MRSRRWACSMNVTACAGDGTIPKPHTAANATAQRAREREGKRNAMRPQGRKRTKRPDAGAVTMGNKHRAAIIPCCAFVAARNTRALPAQAERAPGFPLVLPGRSTGTARGTLREDDDVDDGPQHDGEDESRPQRALHGIQW